MSPDVTLYQGEGMEVKLNSDRGDSPEEEVGHVSVIWAERGLYVTVTRVDEAETGPVVVEVR